MQPDALIISGDSKVGVVLREKIAATGRSVIATTRRLPYAAGMLPFDLRYDSWLPVPEVAYFATGITGFKPCEVDPAETHRINVVLQVRAAKRLWSAGCRKFVFLSSAAAETHPETIYGISKINAEREFMLLGAACYRFGPIAFPWKHVFPNEVYSPINLSTLSEILLGAFDSYEPGIHSVYNRDWVKEEPSL